MSWLLPISGLGVGVLIGLTGIGGGILMLPLLILGFGLPPSVAIGTDVTYAALTKLIGTWQHWRQGTVDRPLVRDLALGSLPASLLAVWLISWIYQRYASMAELWLSRAIGITMFLAALVMLRRLPQGREPAGSLPVPYRPHLIVLIGAVGGFLVGLTSVGSGSLILALLVLVTSLSPERLVGTDIAHATVLLSVTALAHLYAGRVDLTTVGLLLMGSIPGVLVGSRLTLRVPRRALQTGLAGLLVILAFRLVVL